MEKKQIIPHGTRWGSLTYIRDLENDEPKKRPILVRCNCGIEKSVDLAHLRQNHLFVTCGSSVCRRVMQDNLKIIMDKNNRIEANEFIRTNEPTPMDELKAYWDKIERTGNVHNIAEGMRMTINVIGKY